MMYDDGTRTVALLYSSASASFNVVLYDTVPGESWTKTSASKGERNFPFKN